MASSGGVRHQQLQSGAHPKLVRQHLGKRADCPAELRLDPPLLQPCELHHAPQCGQEALTHHWVHVPIGKQQLHCGQNQIPHSRTDVVPLSHDRADGRGEHWTPGGQRVGVVLGPNPFHHPQHHCLCNGRHCERLVCAACWGGPAQAEDVGRQSDLGAGRPAPEQQRPSGKVLQGQHLLAQEKIGIQLASHDCTRPGVWLTVDGRGGGNVPVLRAQAVLHDDPEADLGGICRQHWGGEGELDSSPIGIDVLPEIQRLAWLLQGDLDTLILIEVPVLQRLARGGPGRLPGQQRDVVLRVHEGVRLPGFGHLRFSALPTGTIHLQSCQPWGRPWWGCEGDHNGVCEHAPRDLVLGVFCTAVGHAAVVVPDAEGICMAGRSGAAAADAHWPLVIIVA
mmetsp:Transcript_44748/g.80175  ORF Transcript_44748/g.80175 Transcript_44748/m.80175 type:complete len:394 (+) Transcript_44748:1219-2400(+)